MKRILRLQKAIVFTIVLCFILSPFLGFDVYHTVQAATVKTQKESMWCYISNTYTSDDKKISITEYTDATSRIIYYKKKLYFKKYPNLTLDQTKSEKGGSWYTRQNYVITSNKPKIVHVSKDSMGYALTAKKPGTATITVKDKKGNVLNKTRITVTKPTYRVDYKTLFKDLQNTKYTAGDTFYLSEYLLYNGKSLTAKQKEQVNKYGASLECSSNGVSAVWGKRNDTGNPCFGFSLSRYQTKQKAERYTSKNDVNEQRVILCEFNKGDILPEKTEVATKPEDGSWHVFYKGETAKLPFSIKNQTPERLRELGIQGSSTIFPNFVSLKSFYSNNIFYNEYDYEYLTFDTSKSYLENVQLYDALKDEYPDYLSQDPLTDFWVVTLPITGEGETYYPTENEYRPTEKKWSFPYIPYNSEVKNQQVNIVADGITYSTTNKDDTIDDFLEEYDVFVRSNQLGSAIVNGKLQEKKIEVTVIADGTTYNLNNELDEFIDKYWTNSINDLNCWDGIYAEAKRSNWILEIKTENMFYSSEHIDGQNTLKDFGKKYNLSVDVGDIIGDSLPEDFSFTYELKYKGQQIFKMNCHV